ncbi:MAG TPA: FGGY family carbohydrate kinase [Steroidobacteraceae bacterium]|nr:FGGY family carbohydrate kinase [Steroidobacteraceae bacterium]
MSLGGSDEDLAWLATELSAIRRELLPAGESRALYLALDQGGNSSRAVVFDAVGRAVSMAHVPIATRREAERIEHSADELAESLLVAARDACESPLAAGRPIVAAGLATQRSTVCCWDTHDGAALSAAISWQDRRNAGWLERTLGERSQWVRELTGLPLSPHYGASKLRWCLDELPAVRLAARDERLAMGPLASFLLHRLCEERPLLADPANASRTLLFDPAILDWSAPLLDAFGIPKAVLPRCVGTSHAFGTLLALGGGARRNIPLRACSGDQSAAIYAFGPPAGGTVFVNVGTGAFVQRIVRDGTVPPPRGLLKSVVHARTDAAAPAATYVHEGTVNGAFSAIEWLRGRVGLDVLRILSALHTTLPSGRVDVLFMNGIGGLGAPFWLPAFPTEFVGLDGRPLGDAPPQELQQIAAVVDSIAFLVAVNVLAMHRAAPLQRLVITGGLASCDYLCEVLADVTGLAVERPTVHEATARGIAFLAAGQPLDWQPAPLDRAFAPTGRVAVLERFKRWREAMAMRGAE